MEEPLYHRLYRIYHERQEKMLSGLSLVHCLNNLFQDIILTQEYLTRIAILLDREEAQSLGMNPVEYNNIHCYHNDKEGFDREEDQFFGGENDTLACCSHHYDKEGNFSTQVIANCVLYN